MIPCFHEEAYIYMNIFKEAFSNIRGMIFNAEPERILTERVYDTTNQKLITPGLGLDTSLTCDGERFRTKFDIIVSLGFVNDEDKFDGISGAKALVLPSKCESLSMVVLEAFTQKVPVLVNAFCEVLKAHYMKSNGGFYYNNQQEFIEYLQYMLEHPDLSRTMGENGAAYVEQNYQWKVIVDKLRYLIEYVTKNGVD